jgi:hypothetical protein
MSTNEPDVVVYIRNSSYMGGIGRRIVARGQPWAKRQDPV